MARLSVPPDPFALLGLNRKTATEADVRKAYAERLKVTRPEDDRAAFMALREAFERARQEARWREQYAAEEDEYEDEVVSAPAGVSQPIASDGDSQSSTPEPLVLEEAPGIDEDYVEDEEDDYVPTDFDKRIDAAMQKLQQALTSPWGPPSTADLAALFNRPELEGIDEYRALQWSVRNFLCHATGYYSENQEIYLPPWLTLRVFYDLDAHFGWVRQPSSHPAERHLNAWLRQVREKISWHATPYEERVKRERDRLLGRNGHQPPAQSDFGSIVWLLAGAGLLISVIIRGLIGSGG